MGSIQTVREAGALSMLCSSFRNRGVRVGFVPTMGALHDGHLQLVNKAKEHADVVVASVFVNPTQFGPNEDFARYPRDIEGDTRKLASAGADAVFVPEVATMYPPGEQTRVSVGALADHLCGPFRPGHFQGVATIVTKLFGMVGESVAVFGRKDYQQLAIIRRLVSDLLFPITVIGMPTVREADGLAMSSRNAYLSPEERGRALAISRALGDCHRAFHAGERKVAALQRIADAAVARATAEVDYVTLADPVSLQPLQPSGEIGATALLAIACRIGKTRLIDNTVLGEDEPPPGEG